MFVSGSMILCVASDEPIVNTQALSKDKVSDFWLVVRRVKK